MGPQPKHRTYLYDIEQLYTYIQNGLVIYDMGQTDIQYIFTWHEIIMYLQWGVHVI